MDNDVRKNIEAQKADTARYQMLRGIAGRSPVAARILEALFQPVFSNDVSQRFMGFIWGGDFGSEAVKLPRIQFRSKSQLHKRKTRQCHLRTKGSTFGNLTARQRNRAEWDAVLTA